MLASIPTAGLPTVKVLIRVRIRNGDHQGLQGRSSRPTHAQMRQVRLPRSILRLRVAAPGRGRAVCRDSQIILDIPIVPDRLVARAAVTRHSKHLRLATPTDMEGRAVRMLLLLLPRRPAVLPHQGLILIPVIFRPRLPRLLLLARKPHRRLLHLLLAALRAPTEVRQRGR